MPRLLVVHHTPSPATRELVESVLAGARDPDISGVDVEVRPALAATLSDMLDADGYVFGTTANIGYMSGALKQYGDTIYYFFPTQDLPLFAPLRTLGVPEPVIDVVEPFFKVIVDLGYDRSIPPWEPTPARLIPPLNPGSVATDLVDSIGEGIDNAKALMAIAMNRVAWPKP